MSSKGKRRRALAREFERRTEPGAPPGTLIPEPGAPPSDVHVMAFGPDGYEEQPLTDVGQLLPLLAKWPVTWVNVDGVSDAALVSDLGRMFKLHRLALEDVMHVHQRAKAEAYGDHYFIVARMPIPQRAWSTEQVSVFFGDRFVLTFQEGPRGDCLDPVRVRIRAGWGRSRAARPDHLVYAILDSIVDHYFPLIEQCGERLDELEELDEGGAARPASDLMARVHGIKRDLLTVRRVIWPLRDALNTLLRDTTPLISDDTRVYLRDVHDHTIQIIDLVETYRDISSSITEVHLSTLSRRTNEIVKVLTIISTIFIPLTFLVGVYGMNFDYDASPWNMPELHWRWGYPVVWLIMAGTGAGMLYYFRRRGWLGK